MAEGRITGSEDVIRTLSERVTELSKRVTYLQAELDAAQKRVAIYEEFDATLQDALSGALNAAHQIRERAETTASQILEQAREERRLLLNEIERLRDERDRLQEEIAEARRGGLRTIVPRAQAARDPEATQAELRLVATEALRGIFQELVDDLRRVIPPAPEPTLPAAAYEAPPPRAEVPVYEPPAPEPLYEEPPPATAATIFEPPTEPVYEAPPRPVYEAPRPEPPAPIESEDIETEDTLSAVADDPPPAAVEEPPAAVAENVVEIREAIAEEDVSEVLEAAAEEPRAAPAFEEEEIAPEVPLAAQDWVRPHVVEPEPYQAPPPPPEPVPVAPPPPPRVAAPRLIPPPLLPPPAPIFEAPRPAPEAPPPVIPPRLEPGEPATDIQLVLSPIGSFPRLVEIERRIQSLPVVRSLYVRDFRAGIATLAVGLRSAMALDEIASALGTLDRPRLRVLSGAQNVLEMRIDGEASIA